MTKALTFIELDIEWCELAYGETTDAGTCPAVLGVDSDHKCFNTKSTCPVRSSYQAGMVTLRFAEGTAYLAESGIDAIACIESISFTPGTISLGEDLGTRSSLRVTMSDFPWSDTGPGFDKYVSERGYDPFKTGTFWGKFRPRHPSLRGRPIRVIRGVLGQTLEQMETRHYVVESVDGPGPDARYDIIAKDALKLLDGDRAQAPRLSNGFLSVDIDTEETTAVLAPVGIGNIDYPASGFVNIGGKEVAAFTRSGDTLTLTRAQYNTEAAEHKAGDRVQLCLEYTSQDVSDILADLMINYAAVPSDWIPLTAWRDETTFFLRTLYTTLITEPTSVRTLCNELIRQAALAIWWDEESRLVRLRVLRQIATDAALFDDSVIVEKSLTVTDQPEKRLSRVWVYFAQVNPLKKVDDADNYRSCVGAVNLQMEDDYGAPAIQKVYSRWIPEGGRAIAERIGNILIGRFARPPRKFKLNAFRHGPVKPIPAVGCRVSAWPFQNAMGDRIEIPAQVVRVDPRPDFFVTELEEFEFTFLDDGDPVVIFDLNTYNVNARATFDLFYPEPEEGTDVYFIVEAGVIVGSVSTELPAMDMGEWPEGVNVHLIINGRIQGAGGKGGDAGYNMGATPVPGTDGGPGGLALYTRAEIIVENNGGIFGGGGGGGGAVSTSIFNIGGGGGGGSGFNPGQGGQGYGHNGDTVNGGANGAPGTPDAGGAGGNYIVLGIPGGAGGGPGLPGVSAVTAGGAAGAAIDGVSYITFDETGDIRGDQIN